MKLPTQSDIARIAGVSRATVSYVLSGRNGGAIKITDETRERVLKAAENLGYQPNAAAITLRSSITRKIGITIPDLNNPHMQAILSGAVQEAQVNDYNILLINTEMMPDFEHAGILELLRRSIDGLVLIPTYINILEEEYQLLTRRRSPIVVAGNYYEHLKELDTVIPGHDQGAKLIMEHLLELGHREIAFIFGVMRKPLGSERLKIYHQMLEEVNIPYREEFVIQSGINYQDGYDAGNALLDMNPRPTAILAINDLLALGALHAAHEREFKIPDDVSIAGFDDNEYSAFLNPSLTTVDVNAHEIGTQCVRMVLERIKNPERPYRSHRITPALKVRNSTGPVMHRPRRGDSPLLVRQEMEVQSNNI